MTSSSTEPAVVRGLDPRVQTHRIDADLRTGAWTRLGGDSLLGDPVTESLLEGVAESARAAARAQGYAVGWAEGRRAGLEAAHTEATQAAHERAAEVARQDAAHTQAVQALQNAAAQLHGTTVQVCAAVEAQALDLALQLVEAVLQREVALASDPAMDAVRRALALVPAGATVTVRLHPADRAGIDATAFADHAVRLQEDATLSRGDAVAETDTTTVDATVAAAVARVREVLA
jgi:flagellar assembly protein FliH